MSAPVAVIVVSIIGTIISCIRSVVHLRFFTFQTTPFIVGELLLWFRHILNLESIGGFEPPFSP